ncbi:resolvase [Methylobacterium oxalidis]|uniref:resolvase n=1 Tax=Methylobacterium oxalidis TaxID=944322 RepID=UPI003314ED2B
MRLTLARMKAQRLEPAVRELQANGVTSLIGLVEGLNDRGIPPLKGSGPWNVVEVARLLARLAPLEAQALGLGVASEPRW